MPTIFPLYTLTLTHNVVVAAGGGGDPLFGKKNGIVIMDSTTAKELIFFKTDDIVRSIQVYTSTQITLPENEDDSSAEYFSADEVSMEPLPTSIVKGVCDGVDNLALLPQCTMYLTLVAMESFSHVKICKDEMHVLERYKVQVDQHTYFNFNIFLAEKKIFAYMPTVAWQIDKRKIKNRQEEYFYGLGRKDDRVMIVREDGHTDVNDNWERFFLKNRRIYKILKEDVAGDEQDANTKGTENGGASEDSALMKKKRSRQRYTFVFNLKKYNFDEEIVSPEIVNDHLVFYLKKSSKVVFIKEEVKEVEMERITCISNHKPDDECNVCQEKETSKKQDSTNETTAKPARCRDCVKITCSHIKSRKDYFITAVGTSSGTLYIFKNTVLVNKITPCAIPITSVAVKDNFVYYCSLNGLIDRRVTVKKRGVAVFVLLCVMVVGLALLIGFYRTYR